MKTSTSEKRIQNKASHTALMAAIYRYLASKETRTGFKGMDHLANIFLPAKAQFFLSFGFFRSLFKKKLAERGPGSYEYVSARTRFFDELFIRALIKDIPQIVFLGAGYDTRAFRFRELRSKTMVFELDVPSTQGEKIRLMAKHRIEPPENLHFVPINFDTDNLKQVLFRAGYDPTQKTLFIWEGVSMYLSEQAVEDTLAFVKGNSGTGSEIVFDYLYKSVIKGECSYYGARELSEIVNKGGEAFTFGIEEGEIGKFLENKGFNTIKHFSPEDFETKYLYNKKEEFFGKMYGFACHVHAKVIHNSEKP